ncbi:MAG TPA: TadE/TadG family type IV pilus assembly protein [Sphingomicrobium sp.]|jgi:Flp pilus assembly protein TadG|nr:TadE/TadG family type IV pilus assembly protein [Sphingomicrobium sp.]
MIRWISKLRGDERGTSIIEMGLAVPFLAALMIGTVDLSRAYSEKLHLEQAAQRAIERVMQNQGSASTTGAIRAEAAEAAGVSPTAVTVDPWLECNGVRQADYNSSCPEGQTYARFLQVSVQKTFTPMFKMRFAGSNPDGSFTLVATAGIRTQ